jgi:hypothetical protein
VPHITEPDHYLTYSNSPRHVTDQDRAKGEAALRSALAKMTPLQR